jgi:hypothetical protein
MKGFLSAASLIALMAAPAFAQETTPPPATQNAPAVAAPAPAAAAKTTAAEISAKKLMSKNVKNAANESVGDINDVLISSDGRIAAVIVGVGGFLGMGEKDVALPFDQLSFATDADNDLVVTTSATKDGLQAAPEYVRPADRS